MKHSFAGRLSRHCLVLVCMYLGFGALSAAQAQTATQTFTTLLYFNGVSPSAALIIGSNGNLFAPAVGAGGGAPAGLIYSAAPDGVGADGAGVDTLYQYGRLSVYTGNGPRGALLLGSDLNLYGTTFYRSAANVSGTPVGSGTIFRMSQDGSIYLKLKDFTDAVAVDAAGLPVNVDGANPQSALIQGTDGLLYGTTSSGGNGTGTIFKIRTDGSGFETLFSFDPIQTTVGTDPTTGAAIAIPSSNADGRAQNNSGAYPTLRLLQASDGDLYGATAAGGVNGTGTLFKIRVDGSGFIVLNTFDVSPPIISDTTDPNFGLARTNTTGAYPSSGLLQAPDGLLYGTTNALGPNGAGTIYSIATDGTSYTVIHSFNTGDGATPSGDLIIGQDGLLTGTTSAGGTLTPASTDTAAVIGAGTIYEMSLDGATFTTLHVFTASTADGAGPLYGVVQDSRGNLYGTTSQGSPYGIGTIFKYGEATNLTTPIGTPVYNGYGAFDMLVMFALFALLLYSRHRLRGSQQI